MTSCAICFTTDRGYLFPTLVAARQARHRTPRHSADILIFSFDADQRTEEVFSRICQQEDIQFVRIKNEAINGAPMTLARLFLDRFVPGQYDQLLYLDGDVQITGPLGPLVDTQVPPGCFLAANDPMTFLSSSGPNSNRPSTFEAHILQLGLPPAKTASYFNAGVLRIDRHGWGEIGSLAWNAFKAKPTGWRFLDQDVLNLVAVDRRLPMSLKWNFPIFLRNARLERPIQPQIYHFMSSPKPWSIACPPWSEQFCAPYLSIIQTYPELEAFNLPMPLRRQIKYQLQQRYKQAGEMMGWGFGARRHRVLEYESRETERLRRPVP